MKNYFSILKRHTWHINFPGEPDKSIQARHKRKRRSSTNDDPKWKSEHSAVIHSGWKKRSTVLDEWTRAKVKNYKLRVLRPNDKSMQKALSASSASEDTGRHRKFWYELDGQQVKFRSDYRQY